MFSQLINLKSKKVYIKNKERQSDKDDLIEIKVEIKSNHNIDDYLISQFERDLNSFSVPSGYKEKRE